MKRKKRVVAIMLSIFMMFSLCTNTAFAEVTDTTDSETEITEVLETDEVDEEDEYIAEGTTIDDTEDVSTDTVDETTTNMILGSNASGTSDTSAVDEVQALIDALPSADELGTLSTEELNEVYADVQAANDAWEALSSDEQALVDDSKLDELFYYFNNLTTATEDEEEESNVTEASTLAELKTAISKASSGDTIKLTADIDYDNVSSNLSTNGYLSIGVGLTIDFDGHKLNLYNSTNTSTTNKLFKINTTETVTFKNGTITGSETEHYYVIFGYASSNSKDLVLDSFTIENFGTGNTNNASTDADSCVFIYGSLTMTDCTFQNNSRRAFFADGKSLDNDIKLENTKIINNNVGNTSVYCGGGFYIRKMSSVTIERCTISGNTLNGSNRNITYGGGGFYISTTSGNITIINNEIKNNTSTDSGGGFCISGGSGLLIENNDISSNKAINGYGGGMRIYNLSSGNLEITKNTIDSNTCVGYGGGIYLLNNSDKDIGKVLINNNVISNNTVDTYTKSSEAGKAEDETASYYSKGGGIAFYDSATAHTDTSAYDLSGNTITNNSVDTTYGRGGGLSLYGNDADREFLITSGTITGNSASWGGGIDYTYHCASILHLYNAIITSNSAASGGGLWSCPSSTTTMYVTLGGTIYGNTATSLADSIRFEGDGSDYSGSGGVFATVAARALGGTLMDWYSDESGARYVEGDTTVNLADYTNRTTSFSLHGELSDEGIALAEVASSLTIANNKATNVGGGIASNAGVVFGNDGEVSVTVNKEWITSSGNTIAEDSSLIPESVTVQLIRVDSEGEEVYLEAVELNAKNGWSYTFEELPTNYTYKVVEVSEGDYTVSYSDVIEGEDGNYSMTITNTVETVDITGTKTWDDASNQDGKRPESITVNLYADNELIESQTIEGGDSDIWSYSFTELPKYNNGKEIIYTVTEDAVTNYSTTYDGYNITNSYTPEKTSVTVVKVWDDSGDKDGIRPDEITVVLLKNGEETDQTITLSADNQWIGSFTDLDVYTNGKINEYTVEEVGVDGYTSVITGNASEAFVITNTHTPETIPGTSSEPTNPTTQTETSTTNTVKTSDMTQIGLWIALLFISGCGIVTYKKRKNILKR